MKTTLKKILLAYSTIIRMGNIRRAPATQLKFFKLKKLLHDGFEFYCEEERKLMDEFKLEADEVTGAIKFTDPETKEAYNKRVEELQAVEYEISLEKKIIIRSSEMNEISLGEMEALEEFIDFYE